MFLQFNASAMNAYNNWTMHNNKIAKSLERLSSGNRINRAADDPAGMAVAEKMKTQLRLLETDKRNVADTMSMVSVADATMGQMSSMLDRMLELSEMASNGTYSYEERQSMDKEYQQLLDEVNRLGKGTSFNGMTLFHQDGAAGASQTVGPENAGLSEELTFSGGNLEAYLDGLDNLLSDISLAASSQDEEKLLSLGIDRSNGKTDSENLRLAVQSFTKDNAERLLNTENSTSGFGGRSFELVLSSGNITVNISELNSSTLGLQGTNLRTQEDAQKASDALKDAIKSVASSRGDMGALYNRLEHTTNSLSAMEENLTESLSRITDTDMAKEMMTLVKEQLLAQVSMFAMAQANQRPSQVLSLIQGM